MTRRISKEKIEYTIFFVATVAIILVALLINDRTFVSYYDAYYQYYPVFLYIGRYLRGILAGKLYWYDFSIGFGEDIIGSLNYYGFGDPINLLAVFATQNNGYIIYAIVILIKLYLSGTGMMKFLAYHKCDGMLSVGGALIYALSLYSISWGVNNYMFLGVVWVLPYLLTNLEKLIKDDYKTNAILKFVLLITLTSCSGGFYFLYIQSLLLTLYAVMIYFNEYKNLISLIFFRKLLQVFSYYLLGVMISGIFLFPTIYAFFNSSRTIGENFGWSFIWDRERLRLLFSNLIVLVRGTDKLGLALPIVGIIAAIGCIVQKNIRKELGIPTIILGLMYICPAFWRITNGLSYPENRWIYIIYFWIAYISVMVMQLCINGNVKRIIYVYAFLIVIVSVFYHYYINRDKIRCIVPLIYGVLFVVWGVKNSLSRKKVLFLIASGVWLNVFLLYANWRVCGYDMWTAYRNKEDVVNISDIDLDYIENGQWKRMEVNATTRNDGLVKGYMSTSEYISLMNGNVSQFYQDFMISSGFGLTNFSLQGTDDRIAIKAILSAEKCDEGNTVSYGLPFGVMYTAAIDYSDFLELSIVERQRIPLSYIILGGGGYIMPRLTGILALMKA